MPTRTQLYRVLYLAARNNVTGRYRQDSDHIKSVRDDAVELLFPGQNYTDLSEEELSDVINLLNRRQDRSHYEPRATYQQRSALYYYCLYIALHESEFDNITVDTGNSTISGEAARRYLIGLFNDDVRLPANIVRYCMSHYINPLLNRWLQEGGFKSNTRNQSVIYINSLSRTEARYLIQRLRKFSNEIANYHPPERAESQSYN